MSTHALTLASVAPLQIGPGDRWIRRAKAAAVVGFAGIAGALSYSHTRQLAQDHGQVGWHAHAFPLSVDGIEIVASLVLLANCGDEVFGATKAQDRPATVISTSKAASPYSEMIESHGDSEAPITGN